MRQLTSGRATSLWLLTLVAPNFRGHVVYGYGYGREHDRSGLDPDGGANLGAGDDHLGMSSIPNAYSKRKKTSKMLDLQTSAGIKPLAEKLEKLPRRLRGADPADIVTEVQDVMTEAQGVLQDKMSYVQTMLEMHADGEEEDFAAALKAFVGDTVASVEAAKESKEIAHHFRLDEGIDLRAIPNLDDVPAAQVAEYFNEKTSAETAASLGRMQDNVKLYDDVKLALQPYSRRQLKENLFSHQKSDDAFRFDRGNFEHGSDAAGAASYRPQTSASGRNAEEKHRQASARGRGRLPDIRKLLKLKESQRRRRAESPLCQPSCQPDDSACTCNRLVSCISNMSDYDITQVFVQGYINTDTSSDDYAKFTVTDNELNLFDADFGIYNKIRDIRSLAQDTAKCSELLMELHSACNPLQESCSSSNVQSFQVTVDDVCSFENTDVKLLLASISDELDGYAAETSDGTETFTTTCGARRVAFDSCQVFAQEFEKLYEGRDETDYPKPNPMRPNSEIPVDVDSGVVLFPLHYRFDQASNGVASLALDNAKKCPSDECIDRCVTQYGDDGDDYCSKGCVGESDGQITNRYKFCDINEGARYSYCWDACEGASSSESNKEKCRFGCEFWDILIRNDDNTLCMQLHPNNGGYNHVFLPGSAHSQCPAGHEVTQSDCLSALNELTGETRTNLSNQADWDYTPCGCFLWSDCDPSCFDYDMNCNNAVQSALAQIACKVNDPNNVQGSECQDNSENENQIFHYNPSSHQIKHGDLCLDYNFSDGNVYMYACHTGLNQKWFYKPSTKELKSFYNDLCLEMEAGSPNNMYMTSCSGEKNQQFRVPYSWLPVISAASLYNEIRTLYDVYRCMDANPNNDNVYTYPCDDANANQQFYYDAATRQIKHGNDASSRCVDYNYDNMNVYMNTCHDGLNQKWYVKRSTKEIKSYYDDKCLDMRLFGQGDDGKYNIYMQDCNSRENQHFLVPMLWIPLAELDELRVFQNRTLCIDADPDYNNNVYMDECASGDTNQDFFYDSRTFQIKHRGLCLDHNFNNDNVYLHECHTGDNQQWFTDGSNRLKTKYDDSKCLDWKDDPNNLCMSACQDQDNQKFTIPTKWLPAIETAELKSRSTSLQETHTYNTRPIPTGIWNGDWNERTVCTVDTLKDVINTCDKSMTLLLGHVASLGTLRDTANLIAKQGPSRMPGKCCLDNPSNSQWIGYQYDPTRGMECAKRGPWHLGISEEACQNANGRWFRSPCVTLQECIANRPNNSSEYYSQSFENFAIELVIDDPSDEDECRSTREGLSFDADYPYDTEVCEYFHNQMCDPFYGDLDSASDDTDVSWKNVEYDPPDYPPDPDLTKTPLPAKPSLDVASDDDAIKTSSNALQETQQVLWGSFQLSNAIETKNSNTIMNTCSQFPWYGSIPCWLGGLVLTSLGFFTKYAALIAWQAVSISYIAVSQQKINYSKLNYDNMVDDGIWTFNALNIINDNVYNQHTQVRKDLQDRHLSMEVNINTYSMCSTNYLGIEILSAIDPNADIEPLSSECQNILGLTDNASRENQNQRNIIHASAPYKLLSSGRINLTAERMPLLEQYIADELMNHHQKIIGEIVDMKSTLCEEINNPSPQQSDLPTLRPTSRLTGVESKPKKPKSKKSKSKSKSKKDGNGLSRNLKVSDLQSRSDGKMEAMEESLEAMRREVKDIKSEMKDIKHMLSQLSGKLDKKE